MLNPAIVTTEVFLNHLRETLKNPDNKLCFILGAGASKESGIDTGAELAQQWYAELPSYHSSETIDKWKFENKFDENKIPFFYSKLFKFRYQGHRDNGIFRITNIIEKGNPGFGYTILSQVLQSTHHNIVITTNFDTLTEESIILFTGKRALVCAHEKIAQLARPSSNRPLIIKIHRGLYMDPLNEEEEIAVIKSEWKDVLSSILGNYIPIVIGYGGNDGSLMNYLRDITPCQRMYWCISTDQLPRSDIVDIVNRHKGTFVVIGSFNRLMFRFIELFGVTKVHEIFPKLAQERAEKLTKEFEEAGNNISKEGSTEEKSELSRVADGFDFNNWIHWELKASSVDSFEEKKKIYLTALTYLPNSYQLLSNFGRTLRENNYDYDALVNIKKAIELKSDEEIIWNNLGCSYSKLGDLSEALKAFDHAIELNPNFYQVWNNIGAMYEGKGEFDNAVNSFKKSIAIEPNYVEAWKNLANTLRKKKEFKEAIKSLNKALELRPNDDDAWYNIGNTFSDNGEFEKSINAYLEAIKINPSNEKAWFNLGNSYNEILKLDEAINSFHKSLDYKPDVPEVLYNLGNSLCKKGLYNEAINVLRKAVEVKPDYHEAWNSLGNALNHNYQFDEAINALNKALSIKPNKHTTLHNLGYSYLFKNDTSKAYEFFSQALKLCPGNLSYKKALDDLNKL